MNEIVRNVTLSQRALERIRIVESAVDDFNLRRKAAAQAVGASRQAADPMTLFAQAWNQASTDIAGRARYEDPEGTIRPHFCAPSKNGVNAASARRRPDSSCTTGAGYPGAGSFADPATSRGISHGA